MTPLTAGDLIVVQALGDHPTRLAPGLASDEEKLRALTIELRFPRALASEEITLALWAADLVKPSKARVLARFDVNRTTSTPRRSNRTSASG